MSLSIYEASVPVFRAALTNMRAWLDKPEAREREAGADRGAARSGHATAPGAISDRLGLGEERHCPAVRH